MAPIVSECCFCDEFGPHVPSTSRRVLIATTNFVAFVDTSPISRGHTLIAPRGHFTSFAEMPVEIWLEAVELKERVFSRFPLSWGHPVSFEHGAVGESAGGCGISHAHVHLLPLPPAINILELIPPGPSTECPFELLSQTAESGRPYLFVEDPNGGRLFYPKDLPSQFMRRRVAEAIGKPDWDWRQSNSEDIFDETLYTLGRAS
jgi:diadenosine tetraphosphate (Ap4A) HIT family hydrolase